MSDRIYYCRPDAEPKLYPYQPAGEGRVDILDEGGRVIVAGARLVTEPKEGCAIQPDALDAPELLGGEAAVKGGKVKGKRSERVKRAEEADRLVEAEGAD